MHWITSAGGPLVLVPKAIIGQWRGTTDGGDDYSAACDVSDYAGVIHRHGVDILVLNDEPHATSCMRVAGTVVLIRWRYAPSESAILEAIETRWAELPPPAETATLAIFDPRCVLFDAGALGDDVTEALEVEMPIGSCRVETYAWEPSDGVGLVLHRLVPQHE